MSPGIERAGIVAVILTNLCFLAALGSGIWLAILGSWGLIGLGLLTMVGGIAIISVAMFPSIVFTAPAMFFVARDMRLGYYIFGFLCSAYMALVAASWSFSVIYFFVITNQSAATTPTIVWSYAIAMAPMAYLSIRDAKQGNEYSLITLAFSHVALLLALLTLVIARPHPSVIAAILAATMLASASYQFVHAARSDQRA